MIKRPPYPPRQFGIGLWSRGSRFPSGPSYKRELFEDEKRVPAPILQAAVKAKEDGFEHLWWFKVGGTRLYFGRLPAIHVLIRSATKAEWNLLHNLRESECVFDRADILGKCILCPVDFHLMDVPAGWVENALSVVEAYSVWGDDKLLSQAQDMARKKVQGERDSVIKMAIGTTIPSVSPVDVMAMDAWTILDLLSAVEVVRNTQWDLDPGKGIDEQKKRQNRAIERLNWQNEKSRFEQFEHGGHKESEYIHDAPESVKRRRGNQSDGPTKHHI